MGRMAHHAAVAASAGAAPVPAVHGNGGADAGSAGGPCAGRGAAAGKGREYGGGPDPAGTFRNIG